MGPAAANEIAERFPSPWLRGYARGKLQSDPVYARVIEILRHRSLPLLDLGCGIGLLEFLLREEGCRQAIQGIDFDSKKIEVAREIARTHYEKLDFQVSDVREPRDFHGDVAILDLLHYFSDGDQQAILEQAATYAGAGGVVVIRECPRDGSWRYRMTYAEEAVAMSIGWLRGGRLNFPAPETIVAPFRSRGFTATITPLWGNTPFNNHLFLFTQESKRLST